MQGRIEGDGLTLLVLSSKKDETAVNRLATHGSLTENKHARRKERKRTTDEVSLSLLKGQTVDPVKALIHIFSFRLCGEKVFLFWIVGIYSKLPLIGEPLRKADIEVSRAGVIEP